MVLPGLTCRLLMSDQIPSTRSVTEYEICQIQVRMANGQMTMTKVSRSSEVWDLQAPRDLPPIAARLHPPPTCPCPLSLPSSLQYLTPSFHPTRPQIRFSQMAAAIKLLPRHLVLLLPQMISRLPPPRHLRPHLICPLRRLQSLLHISNRQRKLPSCAILPSCDDGHITIQIFSTRIDSWHIRRPGHCLWAGDPIRRHFC